MERRMKAQEDENRDPSIVDAYYPVDPMAQCSICKLAFAQHSREQTPRGERYYCKGWAFRKKRRLFKDSGYRAFHLKCPHCGSDSFFDGYFMYIKRYRVSGIKETCWELNAKRMRQGEAVKMTFASEDYLDTQEPVIIERFLQCGNCDGHFSFDGHLVEFEE